jgi:hypothetical protein
MPCYDRQATENVHRIPFESPLALFIQGKTRGGGYLFCFRNIAGKSEGTK